MHYFSKAKNESYLAGLSRGRSNQSYYNINWDGDVTSRPIFVDLPANTSTRRIQAKSKALYDEQTGILSEYSIMLTLAGQKSNVFSVSAKLSGYTVCLDVYILGLKDGLVQGIKDRRLEEIERNRQDAWKKSIAAKNANQQWRPH